MITYILARIEELNAKVDDLRNDNDELNAKVDDLRNDTTRILDELAHFSVYLINKFYQISLIINTW